MEGIRWTQADKFGNEIYLTEERWEHITNQMNHPEMLDYENNLQETIGSGVRKQEALNPQKFRYTKTFESLTSENTHIVAVVIFRLNDNLLPNNFVVTAYQKKVW